MKMVPAICVFETPGLDNIKFEVVVRISSKRHKILKALH